jgi:pyruvate oxidase
MTTKPLDRIDAALVDDLRERPRQNCDDAISVGIRPKPARTRTVADVMVKTMTNWGVQSVFGMVGQANLGLPDSIRLSVIGKKPKYYGIRHESTADWPGI